MAHSNSSGTDSVPIPLLPQLAWFGTPDRIASHVQRLMQHLQQAQSTMFQHISRDTQVAGQEASHATQVPDLLNLQWVYVAEEFSRVAQFYTQIVSGLFDAQAQWIKELESNAATLLGGTLSNTQASALPPAWPALWGPAGVFQAAQATWGEMNKVMLDALQHDLQEAPATPEESPSTAKPTSSRRPAARH
jgi:hypothetical protein